MYAVVSTGGKQYRVAEGDRITVEKLEGEVGSEVSFDRVLLVVDGDQIKVGRPHLEDAKVKAEVVGHGRGKKVVAFKKEKRKNYSRWVGHRQANTEVIIKKIVSG